MAKNRTLNEIRQSKEYQRALNIQTKKVQDNRTHPCSESTAEAIAKHQSQSELLEQLVESTVAINTKVETLAEIIKRKDKNDTI